MKPEQLPIVRTARQLGFGCGDTDGIDILGDDFCDKVARDFELPQLIPVRFSLPQVFRSIAKQILILVKRYLGN